MSAEVAVVRSNIVEVKPKTPLNRLQGRVALIVWETIRQFLVIDAPG